MKAHEDVKFNNNKVIFNSISVGQNFSNTDTSIEIYFLFQPTVTPLVSLELIYGMSLG